MYRKVVIALLLMAGSIAANAQHINTARLDSLFNAIEANHKGMGSFAVSQNGVLVYQKAFGYSAINGSTHTNADIKTRYRIGSISKMFTAVMVFQLIDEGKLNLSNKLARFFPEVPNADKITITQMLGHRSGIHNFTADSSYLGYMLQPHTEAQMLAIIAANKPDFTPDTTVAYSNSNFVLLGYIVEKVTGKSYAENLQQRITTKIGLADTYYGGKIGAAGNEAHSYVYNKGWQQESETDMSIPGGAGAVVSTPADLVKFIDALFAGKLINPNDVALMQTIKKGYGLAMFPLPFGDKTAYGHNGAIDAFQNITGHFPVQGLSFSYCSNGVNYPFNDILIDALSICFNKPFQIPSFKTLINSPAELDKYTGTYSSKQIPLKVIITKAGINLVAQATGQSAITLEAIDKDKFGFAAAGIIMEFTPADGSFNLKQGAGIYLFTKDK